MGKFQGLSRCPRKMVLYSSTKFGIIKPWTNIPWLWRFDWSFQQTSKQLYRKLQYRENVFRKFQCLPRFFRKMFLYWLNKFGIKKPWTNIPWLRIFHLGFWQSSKEIYTQLQYRKKFFGEFQGLLHFPRKMVLYSSTKFGILKPWTNVPWIRRFDLGFWQNSKQIYRKLQNK